jgi:hypothetical protein
VLVLAKAAFDPDTSAVAGFAALDNLLQLALHKLLLVGNWVLEMNTPYFGHAVNTRKRDLPAILAGVSCTQNMFCFMCTTPL